VTTITDIPLSAQVIDGLPKRPRGRPSAAAELKYREQVAAFCALISQIQSSMDFAVGSRGWCYLLERHGLRKGDFDAAQRLINEFPKSGELPLDICAEDASRETIGIEQLDHASIDDEVESWIDHLRNRVHENYTPISFWDDLDVYIEMETEKLDLRNLFESVCVELHVLITNLKGWSDLNSRAAMMRRFAKHEAAGRRCVLLLCGDHDPGGLHITEKMRKNLEDLSGAVGWTPENLVIIRFGLNADFIDAHGLTWIDNLETSSGEQLDDPEHSYIAEFGVRKCEANALVVVPEIGRALFVLPSLNTCLPTPSNAMCASSIARVNDCARQSGAEWSDRKHMESISVRDKIELAELQELTTIANQIAVKFNGSRDTCVLTSFALHDVLQRLGYSSRPLRIEAAVFPDDRKFYGTILGSWREPGFRQAAAAPGMWKGHLAVTVEDQWLLDPTLDQANKREWPQATHVGPLAVRLTEKFWAEHGSILIRTNKCTVRFSPHPRQTGFKNAGDARPSHWKPLADLIFQVVAG